MIWILIKVLFSAAVVASEDELLIAGLESRKDYLTNIIRQILDNYFQTSNLLVIFEEHRTDDLGSFIAKTYTSPLFRIQTDTVESFAIEELEGFMFEEPLSVNYIIILNQPNQLNRIMYNFWYFRVWNPPRKCMVVFPSYNYTDEDVVNIFNSLEEVDLVNSIVVAPKCPQKSTQIPSGSEQQPLVLVYSYELFSQSHCRFAKESIVLDYWDTKSFVLKANLFPKQIKNLHKCYLHLKTFTMIFPYSFDRIDDKGDVVSEGTTAYILKTFQEKLNFTLELHGLDETSQDVGFVLYNGTMTGDLLDLFYGTYEGAFKLSMAASDKLHYFDMILSREILHAIWITPLPETYPLWMDIFFEFQALSWIVTALSYLLVVACLKMIKRLHVYQVILSYESSFLYSLSILLGISVRQPPPRLLIRFVFVLWALVSLVINTSYQAALLGFLTKPKTYPTVNTMQDVIQSGLHFGGQSGARGYFMNSDDFTPQVIYQKWVTEEDQNRLFQRVVERKDFAFVAIEQGAAMFALNSFFTYGTLLFHIGSEKFHTFPTAFYMKRGSPFTQPFRNIIDMSFEAGLFHKWQCDAFYYYIQDNLETSVELKVSEEKAAIKLKSLVGAFALLGLGYCCGLITFITEFVLKSSSCRIKCHPRKL